MISRICSVSFPQDARGKSFCGTFIVLMALVLTPCGFSQEKDPASTGQQMDEMMKLWKQVATPGDEHRKLDSFVGTWETETRMWTGPGDPMITKGEAEVHWVLGGRFLQQKATGEMMGQPFEGTGFTGYDVYNKKYVGFWIDNSSTAMFTMRDRLTVRTVC